MSSLGLPYAYSAYNHSEQTVCSLCGGAKDLLMLYSSHRRESRAELRDWLLTSY